MDKQLPVEEIIDEIKSALVSGNTLILQAPPGAGKSTFLPAQLLDEPWLKGKKIYMLQPRRLATKAVAARLAYQLKEEVGETVGYRIRFESRTGKNTRLEILTEGILTRMLQEDGALEDAGMIILDEFHERSIHADLALALAREIQLYLRPDLRLLIMSATLDGAKISTLLGNAPIITSKGRQHPVQFHYAGYDEQIPLPSQMTRIILRALKEHAGDVLAFLPGAAEIMRTAELLENENAGAKVFPLYGDLPLARQMETLQHDPDGKRKIVLATSIAETSLTIEGIQVVVDCGWSRVPRFDPSSGLMKLQTVRVTKDAADQRAGRAGRLGPGVCYRLWTEGYNHHLVPHRSPEILEADLAALVLDLAKWGTADPEKLAWLTPPPAGAVAQAKMLLRELGALEGEKITERGKEMARLPTHPRLAHLLTEAKKSGSVSLATDIVALLEERDPLLRDAGADLVLRLEILRKWRSKQPVNADRKRLERIERVALSWRNIFKERLNNDPPSPFETGFLLGAAYPERIAKWESATNYRLANGKLARLDENDPLTYEKWIVVANLDAGRTGTGKIFLAAPIDPSQLIHLAHTVTTMIWDRVRGELVARKERRLGGIILESQPLKEISDEERINILTEAVRNSNLELLSWTESAIHLQERILNLRKWRPEEGWPDLNRDHMLATIESWLPPWLATVKKKDDFRKISLEQIFLAMVDWKLQDKIDKLAPEKILVPSGSWIKVKYQADGSQPVLAVRLQEIFGMKETPLINEGRTKLLIHLLSPAFRAVQVTQDLASFWKNTYPEVRKELRTRYPKHHWPDDPYTAEAVRGARRKR